MNLTKLRVLPSLALLFPLDCMVAFGIVLTDLTTAPLRLLRRPRKKFAIPDVRSITIQILNWDGKHLLEECLPTVLDAVRCERETFGRRHEVLVVDNGSQDGSVEFLKARFPEVRILSLDRNYGFAIGNNRGIEHVQTDIVLLLNNDMCVKRDFIAPLLEPFSDPAVFATTSQIFFSDVNRRREETGKTRGRFERGSFYLWHDVIQPTDETEASIPVFWAGGGSCAIDRRKLSEI